MSWEALTAIGTLISAAVIAISVSLALRQVNQLRRTTQLDGTMRIFAQFSDPHFIAARNFVLDELPEKLRDSDFVEELRSYKKVDLVKHPEYRVLLFLQLVGCLVKNRLVDGAGIFEFAQYSILRSWTVLEPVVRMQRESMQNPYMWGGADFLYESAKQWIEHDSEMRHIVNPATGEPFRTEQLR